MKAQWDGDFFCLFYYSGVRQGGYKMDSAILRDKVGFWKECRCPWLVEVLTVGTGRKKKQKVMIDRSCCARTQSV